MYDDLQNLPLSLAGIANDQCVVYSHSMKQGRPGEEPTYQPLYIGVCKMTDLFSIKDARKNTMWNERLGRAQLDTIFVSVLGVYPDRVTADQVAEFEIATRRPAFNIGGTEREGRKTAIIHNESGERFQSIAEAARKLGVPASSISNHLNNVYGYRTVRGGTFRRI